MNLKTCELMSSSYAHSTKGAKGSNEILPLLPVAGQKAYCSPGVVVAFSSSSTARRKVIFGRPLFLFPSGIQCRAVLMMEPSSLRSTCPIHRQRLFMIVVAIVCWLIVSLCALV